MQNLRLGSAACQWAQVCHAETVHLRRFLSGPFGATLKYGLSIGVLGWLISQVDWNSLAGLSGVNWRLALPPVLLAGLAYPLQAWRWQILLGTQDIRPPTRWVHGVFWVGNFYNSFLPGGVAGDAVRFTYLWQTGSGRKAAAAASLVADRLLGLGSLCALAVLGLGLQLATVGGGADLRLLFVASCFALVLLLGLGCLVTRPSSWAPVAERWLGGERAATWQVAAQALAEKPRALIGGILISAVIWLLDFAALWLLAGSVGLAVGGLVMGVAGAAAYVAASLPISIGGHGVREGALVAVLALLGIGQGQPELIAVLALAFWGINLAWSLVGGLVHLSSLLLGWPLPRAPKVA